MSISTSAALKLAESFNSKRTEYERLIVDTCPIPMFVADSLGNLIHINSLVSILFGVPSESILETGWFINAKQVEQVKAAWNCIVKSEGKRFRIRFEYRYDGDGGPFNPVYCYITKTDLAIIGYIIPVCKNGPECPNHDFLLVIRRNSENHADRIVDISI